MHLAAFLPLPEPMPAATRNPRCRGKILPTSDRSPLRPSNHAPPRDTVPPPTAVLRATSRSRDQKPSSLPLAPSCHSPVTTKPSPGPNASAHDSARSLSIGTTSPVLPGHRTPAACPILRSKAAPTQDLMATPHVLPARPPPELLRFPSSAADPRRFEIPGRSTRLPWRFRKTTRSSAPLSHPAGGNQAEPSRRLRFPTPGRSLRPQGPSPNFYGSSAACRGRNCPRLRATGPSSFATRFLQARCAPVLPPPVRWSAFPPRQLKSRLHPPGLRDS